MEEFQITVLIGPYNEGLSQVSDSLEIPYLSLEGSPSSSIDRRSSTNGSAWLVLFEPPNEVLSRAVMDISTTFSWKTAAVLYESQKGTYAVVLLHLHLSQMSHP